MPNIVRYHFNDKKFDRARFIAAVLKMKTMLAPGFPNLYDKYIQWHATAGFNAVAHRGLAFLAWHRALLWEFEKDLQLADVALGKDGVIGLPWWDWINDTSTDPKDARGSMWRDNFLGPNGTSPSNEVLSGSFVRANWRAPAILATTTPPQPPYLRRTLGGGPLASADDIKYAISLSSFDVNPFTERAPETSFRNVLEGSLQRADNTLALHNAAHGWIGGNMNNVLTSPYEPAFWLNHANVDRLWAIWQTKHPKQTNQWPLDGSIKQAPLVITNAGVGYKNGTYINVSLIGGLGVDAKATIIVVGGEVISAIIVEGGFFYQIGDELIARASDLGGSTPVTGMGLKIPPNGTINEFDSAYPLPNPRPANVLKLVEPMVPWDGTLGTRIWNPLKVLAWQQMGPAGEHQYRYDTDPPNNFSFM
jgi:tyrosinase